MSQITPVTLCGGAGANLWPLSHSGFPKQFLVLFWDDSRQSVFQKAVARMRSTESNEIQLSRALFC
jgi:mannose-1-phosphate guanylyltransferase/mannose-6-phosphate isomerase